MASRSNQDTNVETNIEVDTGDTVLVNDVSSDNAVLLLAAAEELGQDPHVVQISGGEGFIVPRAVAAKAGLAPKTKTEKE
jgi:hypothetical protein